jgi:hypothetical protein
MSGFDEGQVTWSEQGLSESTVSSTQHAEKRFAEFIRQFQVGEEFVYRDQLRKNTNMGEYKLEVALEDVMKFDSKLSDGIRERYRPRHTFKPNPLICITWFITCRPHACASSYCRFRPDSHCRLSMNSCLCRLSSVHLNAHTWCLRLIMRICIE